MVEPHPVHVDIICYLLLPMAAERPAIPGVSSRRFACDRCRSLKLRCPRSGPKHEPCYRCTRVEVACTTSPIYRIRNHFAHQPPAQTTTVSHARSRPAAALDTAPKATQLPTPNPEPWHSSLQWHLSDSPACTDHTLQSATPLSLSFSTSTLDLTAPTTPSLNEDALPSLPNQVSSQPIEFDRGDPLCNFEWDLNENEIEPLAVSSPERCSGISEPPAAEGTPTADLSRINETLAMQWNRIRDPALALTLATLVAPLAETHINHPSGILKATNDFLHILRSLARQDALRIASKAPENTIISGRNTAQAQAHRSLSNISRHESSHGLDSTTALLILSSYVHLLRIFTVQFEVICGLLQDVADSGFPSLDAAHEYSNWGGESFRGKRFYLR